RDRPPPAPGEPNRSPLARGPARAGGGAAALAHLVPQRVGDAFPGQDLPQFGKTPAEALPRMRHHGDGSHRAQTFRQRASHSPYTPKTTRPSAATSIRNSPNVWFRSVSSALSMPPDSDALWVTAASTTSTPTRAKTSPRAMVPVVPSALTTRRVRGLISAVR